MITVSPLGKLLAKWRAELGLTKADFARLVGVHQSNISAWEGGANRVSVEVCVRIGRALGHSEDRLAADVATVTREIAGEPGAVGA